MSLYEFTRTLIDIPSITGEEAAVARFLAEHLKSLGYAVELQEVAPERFNLLAATGREARVFFSTHLDTVPPFIASSEDEEFIYGRGACDAKGIIASQIAAAETLRREGVDEIGLLFTVDEELSSAGARAANQHQSAHDCRFLINGEPTDNLLAVGSKGAMRATLTARGRAAHSAYPEQGDSAIDKLLDALEDVRAIELPHDEFFGATTLNIGVIQGGLKPNVIAPHAHAELLFRLSVPSPQIKEELQRAVAGRCEIEYPALSEPQRMLAVEGFEQTIVRFGTDIPYLTNWGRPLLIGPGSILVAHTDEERVAKRELDEAVQLYARLARLLLKRVADEGSLRARR